MSASSYEIDHIVLAARTLCEGAEYVADLLGVKPSPGGKHANLSTHNCLVPLAARRYIEIIAIDPNAPPPTRTRWFGLDDPAVQASLASGPKLVGYVVRTPLIPTTLRMFPKLDPQPATRGDFAWTFGFTHDGRRPGMGALPYFIAWDAQSAHPTDRLPAPDWALSELEIALPCAPSVQMAMTPLALSDVTFVDAPKFALRAKLTHSGRNVVLSNENAAA